MSRGLVVGKFMPLHRGHQLLIESALADVDDLTVVVYDQPDVPGAENMPIRKRLGWVSSLYPQVENLLSMPDPVDGDYQEHDDPKYAQAYADQLAFLGPFDYVFSSESYGESFAKALGAKNVTVDAARNLVPVSGTVIRENAYKHRGLIDPLVYKSLIYKVVFVGTESTGKSTLAAMCAENYKTKWAHEYGRELWESRAFAGVTPSFHDLYEVGFGQYRREEAACLHSDRFMFCDTNPWTTWHWSMLLHGAVDARLDELVRTTMDEYIWFYCANDFGWIDDGTRELAGERSKQFARTQLDDLIRRGINYTVLTGTAEQRLWAVHDVLWDLTHERPVDILSA